ncbi:MAG: leucyl aminopeptidase [Methylococcales bacterium]|nr:leucyl aminopeptidase [Methylococcales bacterium]
MDYSIEILPLDQLETDCVIVGVYKNQQLTPSAKIVDNKAHQLIYNLIERGDITGKSGETLLISVVPDSSLQRVLLVGLGDEKKFDLKSYRKVLTAAIKTLKGTQIKSAACTLAEIEVEGCDYQWRCRQIVEIFNDAVYQFTETKSIKPTAITLSHIQIIATEKKKAAANQGLTQGRAIAKAVSLTKHLADMPGNLCTPTYLAEQAQKMACYFTDMTVDVLEESDLEALKMHSFLAVSRGSVQPAKLICLNYQGSHARDKPIVFVGKGLTFDAGGISLKAGAGMDEMKYDMCGGASVIGVLQAVAEMKLPLNVVGLIPASENMPDADANKPGDILTSMAGKTIEVLNTDAEGRLILCDTLTYAEKFNPEVVIDLATLTGACLVALGRVPSGLLGNDDELCNDLIEASKTACDSVWQLPLWEEYQDQLKSNFADMANIGGRDAGTITAACFLSRFTEDYRWAHLDIAGTAWRSGANKGATGRPVPLLSQYLINRANAEA